MDVSFIWWGKVDSNHRRHCQQIYSLSHLATLEFPRINLAALRRSEQNPAKRVCEEKEEGRNIVQFLPQGRNGTM